MISVINELLRTCINCQPAGRDDDVAWIGGDETDLSEFLADEFDAPEEYIEEIAEFLICPNCKAKLDLPATVGVATENDRHANDLWDKWQERYAAHYQEFQKFLNDYPFLGASHSMGTDLMETIAKFPKTSISDKTFFRARKISSNVKTPADMMPPLPEFPVSEGRFNHHAQSVFYLANSERGAANEVLEAEGNVWIQKFHIKNASNILDLSVSAFDEFFNEESLLAFGLLYSDYLNSLVERRDGWKPEYFILRFIADCARINDFDGIKFQSSRWLEQNLVLFKWDDADVVPVDLPYNFHLPEIFVKFINLNRKFEFSYPKPVRLIENILREFDEAHKIPDMNSYPVLPFMQTKD